ncbi:hypothetical protein ACQ0P8_06555 [Halodesulfovibrio aestuarii]|uniref:Uncharacterized protein n=1 Tax=Halodesulfovibrio aestuarii TaxID=126333 RepID=A0A8G2FCC0_9BACT|nr:hypothetical protein [Halodesulfovibrio aestuarii]SHJ76080.1 hypothetical protein SAMN05660830_03161 [Halodesulfovibrio aestuarii]
METILEFIQSENGQLIGWCCTVGGIFLSLFAVSKTYNIQNRIKNEIRNEIKDSSTIEQTVQKGNKNTKMRDVHGNVNF